MWEEVGSVLCRCLDSVPAWLLDMRSMIDPKLLQAVSQKVLLSFLAPLKPRSPLWESPSLQNRGSDPQTQRGLCRQAASPHCS